MIVPSNVNSRSLAKCPRKGKLPEFLRDDDFLRDWIALFVLLCLFKVAIPKHTIYGHTLKSNEELIMLPLATKKSNKKSNWQFVFNMQGSEICTSSALFWLLSFFFFFRMCIHFAFTDSY